MFASLLLPFICCVLCCVRFSDMVVSLLYPFPCCVLCFFRFPVLPVCLLCQFPYCVLCWFGCMIVSPLCPFPTASTVILFACYFLLSTASSAVFVFLLCSFFCYVRFPATSYAFFSFSCYARFSAMPFRCCVLHCFRFLGMLVSLLSSFPCVCCLRLYCLLNFVTVAVNLIPVCYNSIFFFNT